MHRLRQRQTRPYSNTQREIEDIFEDASKKTGIKITPKTLRAWFSTESGELGVADRYAAAFCGRTAKSALAKHYTDYNPVRLKGIYEKAELRVLSDSAHQIEAMSAYYC